ncbi:MAG: type II toxin-antitoxin system VapC family toxin [Chloroflexota bacterium]
MRFLLDTHTFLWWVEDAPQLSDTVRTTIEDTNNELFFSAASGWEIAIKAQIGKLHVPDNLEQFIIEEVHDNSFFVLPIRLNHTLHVHTLPLLHKDPFDRILISQSNLEKMPLITVDSLISQYDVKTLW